MSGGGNGNFSNGQFGGLPLGGGSGGQGTVPGRPQMPGQGGGFGQARPPMMGNRPMYQTPMGQGGGYGQGSQPNYGGTGNPGGFNKPPMPMGGAQNDMRGGMQATVMPGGYSPPGDAALWGQMPPGVSMGFSPQGGASQNQMGLGGGMAQPAPPRVAPMQPPSAADGYGSDFLFRAMRGG